MLCFTLLLGQELWYLCKILMVCLVQNYKINSTMSTLEKFLWGSEGSGEVWEQGKIFQLALGSPFPCKVSFPKAHALHFKFISCVI